MRTTPSTPWWRGTRGEWWVLVQTVLLVTAAVPRPLAPQVVSSRTGALSLCLLGGILLVAGAMALAPYVSILPHPRDDARLVQRGIYRWLRHPIYAGVILLAAGWAVYWGDLAHVALAVAIAGFYGAKASREEQFLRDRFPDYESYSRRTWRFLPWVY